MVEWTQLLLPIALSAVFVFIASTIVHMVLQWHKPNYQGLSNEDEVCKAIRRGNPSPGQYIFPHCNSTKDMGSPEMMKKLTEGPVGMVWLKRAGPMKLGSFLGKWFGYVLVTSALAAYVARFTFHAGAPYMDVFHLVGVVSWMAYAWYSPADSIWMGKPWSATVRYLVDGLVYGLVTAGTFGWLWPR